LILQQSIKFLLYLSYRYLWFASGEAFQIIFMVRRAIETAIWAIPEKIVPAVGLVAILSYPRYLCPKSPAPPVLSLRREEFVQSV
jgi:hypothetical protein